MAKRLIVRGEKAKITVELNEGPVANELWDLLSLETSATLLGEEVYFPVLLPTATEAPEPKASRWGTSPIGHRSACPLHLLRP